MWRNHIRGWTNSSASGVTAGLVGQFVAVDPPRVHMALAGPDVQVGPAGHPAHVRAQELVGGAEQHLAISRDRGHHLDGVGRGAADVGERLHRRGGVDVGHDDRTGVLILPGLQFLGGDRVGQRATGALIRDQHGFSRGG